jgi:hypothetical protein
MRYAKLVGLTGLLCASLLTSCAAKTTQNQKLPDYIGDGDEIYYQLWKEAETELEECVNKCDAK